MHFPGKDDGKQQQQQQLDFNDPKVKSASHVATPFLSNIHLPKKIDAELANADPNTINMLKPKDQCRVCQKFFAQVVFPQLATGTPACQPKHIKALGENGDGPALKGYCKIYNGQLHGERRGGLELVVKDMVEQHGTDLGKCKGPLAFDSCVDMGKCTETVCDVCQDKVNRAADLALNSGYKGVLPLMEHLKVMCNAASNPEIVELRKQLIKEAQERADFLNKYQSGYSLFSPKKIDAGKALSEGTAQMVEHQSCESLAAVDFGMRRLGEANIEWGKKKPTPSNAKTFCAGIGFCRPDDGVKPPSACQLPEETHGADGTAHEGATEDWVKHDVAKKLTYDYKAKVSQKGQQTTKHGPTKDKVEEKKDTWVTAEVVIRTSGNLVDGMARFEVQVNGAQVGTYDQHNKWRPQDLEESDLPYFFSRNAQGTVTNVHHDPSEKYFSLQLKHEIAKMFSTDLKGDEIFNKPSVSLIERGAGTGGGSVKSTHRKTVLLEKTATHLVVRKTRTGIRCV